MNDHKVDAFLHAYLSYETAHHKSETLAIGGFSHAVLNVISSFLPDNTQRVVVSVRNEPNLHSLVAIFGEESVGNRFERNPIVAAVVDPD